MELFWKAVAAVLLTAVLSLTLAKQEKDMAIVVSMMACCMVAMIAISYLEPVMAFLWELEAIAPLQNDILSVLMKCVGISLVAELAGLICQDAGNTSLGKVLQLLCTGGVLYMSIPVFQSFLSMIQEILGEL